MQDFYTLQYPILLEQIYGAAADPALWPDFVQSLSDAFGGSPCALHFQDDKGRSDPLVLGAGVELSGLRDFEQHFSAINPYPKLALQQFEAGTALCALQCADSREMEPTEFYNDWMRPNHWALGHIGAVLFNSNSRTGVLSVSPTSVRALDNVDRDVKALGLLIPHVSRAIELNQLLVNANFGGSSFDTVLDCLDAAAIVLSANGTVQRFNAAAAQLFDDRHTIALDGRGVPYCIDKDSNDRLRKAIFATSGINSNRASELFRVDRSSGHKVHVGCVLRLQPSWADTNSVRLRVLSSISDGPSQLIVLKEMEHKQKIHPENLRRLFGLSQAEARVVAALASGQTLADYAKENAVSRNTLKSQMSSTFQKMHIGSQTEMLAMLASLRGIPGSE